MFGLDISFNGRKQTIYSKADSRRLGLAVARYVQREVTPLVERRVNRTLQIEPGRPKYPLRWASDKQRRYVMAKLRKAGNLPYKRTGKLAKNWKVVNVLRVTDGEVRVTNNAPMAAYVYGDRVGRFQQPFHKDTGWPLAESELQKEFKRATDQLAGAWPDIIEEVRNA